MRLTGAVRISSETLARLAAAAREHNTTTTWHASTCIEAATTMWRHDHATSAVPSKGLSDFGPNQVSVLLDGPTIVTLSEAALFHSVTLEELLRRILDAAVVDYPLPSSRPSTPPSPKPDQPPAPPAPEPKPPRVVFRTWREARRAGGPAPTSREITGALMGDPGFGASLLARAAGRQTGNG